MNSTPAVGAKVRVLPPFAEAFPGIYTVVEVQTYPDGQASCLLADLEGAFDPKFLEPAEG